MKKRIRKSFSLLLALVMVFSLLPVQAMAEEPEGAIAPVREQEPAGAGAEAAESPVFLLQPESGSHAPGESYLVTWELDRTPDRLELVREEPVGDGVLDVPSDEDEPVLVPVRELDPESTELELTAPEEETVFLLRPSAKKELDERVKKNEVKSINFVINVLLDQYLREVSSGVLKTQAEEEKKIPERDKSGKRLVPKPVSTEKFSVRVPVILKASAYDYLKYLKSENQIKSINAVVNSLLDEYL